MNVFLKNSPKISIVIITYNKEKYIKECLDSILSQDIDTEIICVDDHSTDNTLKILKEYSKQNKKIKIITNPKNEGTCLSRYNGLKKCNGDYLLFVDSDDKLLPKSLNILYEKANSNKSDILEFSTQTNGNIKFQKYLKLKENIIKKDLLIEYQKRKITNQLWNKLISKKVYKKTLKLLNPKLKQDNYSDVIYYLYHFLNNAENVYQTDKQGYFYYDNRGITSTSSTIEQLVHYCNFYTTYNELAYIYSETEELFYWKNIVCNQAIETFLLLSKEEQEKYKKELNKLMADEEIEFLINEKEKCK